MAMLLQNFIFISYYLTQKRMVGLVFKQIIYKRSG
jgi:hypothetical protein